MFNKVKLVIAVGLSSLLFASNAFSQKMEECDTASCKKYFSSYKKAAKRGHPQAMATLGQMYYHGYGVDKNEKLALKYLKKASRNKDAAAQFKAGYIYLTSEQFKDIDDGIEYMEKAAFNEFKGANFMLGMVYVDDKYGEKNISKADEHLAQSYRDKFEQIPKAITYITSKMDITEQTFPKLFAEMNKTPLATDKYGDINWPDSDMEIITVFSPPLETTFDRQLVAFRKPIKSTGTRFHGQNCEKRGTCIRIGIADGTAFANAFLDGFSGANVSGQ